MNIFFDGYYYKHQQNNDVIAFVVGKADKKEFLQIITNDDSYNIPFIEKNKFSTEGIEIDIEHQNLCLKGKIKYTNLQPIKYDIMGPFKFLPMQCRHTIVSMRHNLSGNLVLNGKTFDFSNGIGYIEGDCGNSFPKKYNWVQCNDPDRQLSIMAAIADIPFLGTSFNGCISVIHFNNKEYRLATYLGAKILKQSKDSLEISQRSSLLKIDILKKSDKKLFAPYEMSMSKIIYESPCCTARFRFYRRDSLIFDIINETTSFE